MQQAHKSKNILCAVENEVRLSDASTDMKFGMFAL
jgi:hypothetical protein